MDFAKLFTDHVAIATNYVKIWYDDGRHSAIWRHQHEKNGGWRRSMSRYVFHMCI